MLEPKKESSFPLFSELTQEDRARFEKISQELTFQKGEFILKQGAHPRGVFFVSSGKVKCFAGNKGRREMILNMEGPGAALGLMGVLSKLPCTITAEPIETTVTSFIDSPSFLELMKQSQDFTQTLTIHLARFIETFMVPAHILHVQGSVMHRVASALLRLRKLYTVDCSTDGPARIPIRREDLAGLAGTTAESAVRCLTKLKNKNIVDILGREIRVLNPELLLQISTGSAPGWEHS